MPRHRDLIDRAWAPPFRPDQRWVADFTYVWTLAGFVYVSFVTDVYSRRILGCAAWVHWFDTERLHSAIGYRPPGEYENHYRDTTAAPALEVA